MAGTLDQFAGELAAIAALRYNQMLHAIPVLVGGQSTILAWGIGS